MDNWRPIGVLGGMGPEATVLLQQRLIQAVPAQDDSDHIPLLIDMNPKVPSRIAHLIEGTGENPGPSLAAMAQRLEAAGAVALAMPCNTAHHYADAIVAAVDIPLLNMVHLALDHAEQALGRGGRVGMLASPAVHQTALFEKGLEERGLATVWPKDESLLLAAIRDIKRNGPTADAKDILQRASNELSAGGAGLQFVACSEFSLLADSLPQENRVVDTLDLLVSSIVDFQLRSSD